PLRDDRRAGGNIGESQGSGNQRNHERNNRPFEQSHGVSSLVVVWRGAGTDRGRALTTITPPPTPGSGNARLERQGTPGTLPAAGGTRHLGPGFTRPIHERPGESGGCSAVGKWLHCLLPHTTLTRTALNPVSPRRNR